MRFYQIVTEDSPYPRIRAVKIGFSYSAFFFTWVWALIKGLWGPAIISFFIFMIPCVLIFGQMFEAVLHSRTLLEMAYHLYLQGYQYDRFIFFAITLSLITQAYFGYKGNRMLMEKMKKTGFRPAGPVIRAQNQAKAIVEWIQRQQDISRTPEEVAQPNPTHIWWRGTILVGAYSILLVWEGGKIFSQPQPKLPSPNHLISELAGPQADMHILRHARSAKDRADALQYLRAYAHQAYPYAESRWADILMEGKYGVPRNTQRAIHWYRVSAAAGDAFGLYSLGELAASGQIPGGMYEAKYWFTMAARQGNEDATKDLGYWPWRIYYQLSGISKKDFLALKSAAKTGNPVAEYYYGRALQSSYRKHPKYIQHSTTQAVYWYRRSAKQGFWYAEFDMGQAFSSGWGGLSKDMAKADHWWRLAAMQGEDIAANNLGYSYQIGAGVPQSDIKAVAWFLASNVDGYKPALAKAKTLMISTSMTKKDIEQIYRYLVDIEAPLLPVNPVGSMEKR